MVNIKDLEIKYIDLLLKRCIDLDNNPSLLINYSPEHSWFVREVERRAYELGASNVILDMEDKIKFREELIKTNLEDIPNNPMFRRDKWNENAINNGSFLFFVSLEPDYLVGIDSEKIQKAEHSLITTKPIFNKRRNNGECSWCIASLPTEYWAKELFPNDSSAYEKLYLLIINMCMVNRDDPIKAWDEHLTGSKKITDYLNGLDIESLNFRNNLGTDLTVFLPEHYRFCCCYKENYYGVPIIVNMPSYEVYASPIYNKTEGIVYSAKPLYYNNQVVNNFWLRFEKGKVIDFGAEEGYEVLKRIIEMEEYSSYLGEVALVNYNSPISNTNMVFKETLFDENASCHLALGSGFSKAIDVGYNLDNEEAFKYGINNASVHVDFMFGTSDLEVQAITTNKNKIKIFTNGNFDLNI